MDRHHVPREAIPPGTVYEWKRLSCIGEDDTGYLDRITKDGKWTPVLTPDLAKEPFTEGGLVLMQRSEQRHAEDLARDYRRAKFFAASCCVSIPEVDVISSNRVGRNHPWVKALAGMLTPEMRDVAKSCFPDAPEEDAYGMYAHGAALAMLNDPSYQPHFKL